MKKYRLGLFFIIFVIGLLVAIPLRVCVLLYAIEPSTGFYIKNNRLVPAMNILLIVVTLLLLIPILYKKAERPPLPERSKGLGALSAILAVLLIVGGCFLFAEPFISAQASSVVIGNYLTGITELLASILFFSLASRWWNGRQGGRAGVALLPVVWGVVRLTVSFMHYTTIANISESLLDVLTMVALLLFLYYHARTVGNTPNGKELPGMFAFGLPAALFGLMSTLPRYIAYLISPAKGSLPSAGDLVVILFAVYIITLLVSCLRGGQLPTPAEAEGAA